MRCTEYAAPGTPEVGDNAVIALKDRGAALIANHGLVAVGPRPDKALHITALVERTAQIAWGARLWAGRCPSRRRRTRFRRRLHVSARQPDVAVPGGEVLWGGGGGGGRRCRGGGEEEREMGGGGVQVAWGGGGGGWRGRGGGASLLIDTRPAPMSISGFGVCADAGRGTGFRRGGGGGMGVGGGAGGAAGGGRLLLYERERREGRGEVSGIGWNVVVVISRGGKRGRGGMAAGVSSAGKEREKGGAGGREGEDRKRGSGRTL